MQNSAQNRRPSVASGFQDPFAAFGMGSGRSIFSDFFDRDPFDDPFFSQPFGTFGRLSNRVFRPGFFFEQGSLFTDGPFGHQGRGFLDDRPFVSQEETRQGPVIEEVPDDDGAEDTSLPKSGREPIVEHPDDEAQAGYAAVSRNCKNTRKHQSYPSNVTNNFSQSYSFSSVTYGGPGGAYYTTSTTRRAGADGIVQEEHEEKDSRIGQEVKRVSRGLGDKGHTVTRKRSGEGKEDFLEILHNLTEEEKDDFDQTWRTRAEKSLPGWNQGQIEMLGTDTCGDSKQSRPALPSTSRRWPWAKRA